MRQYYPNCRMVWHESLPMGHASNMLADIRDSAVRRLYQTSPAISTTRDSLAHC
jgi:hypothetical protein